MVLCWIDICPHELLIKSKWIHREITIIYYFLLFKSLSLQDPQNRPHQISFTSRWVCNTHQSKPTKITFIPQKFVPQVLSWDIHPIISPQFIFHLIKPSTMFSFVIINVKPKTNISFMDFYVIFYHTNRFPCPAFHVKLVRVGMKHFIGQKWSAWIFFFQSKGKRGLEASSKSNLST